MSEITASEYWEEIEGLAANIAAEAMQEAEGDRDAAEDIIDNDLLHETINSHQWIIYYAYNLDVIKHSNNENYAIDTFGGEYLADILKNKGLNDLHTAIAFWAMYADVQDKTNDALDELEN